MTEKLKEKVEEYFGCEFELFIEFTGLIRFDDPLLLFLTLVVCYIECQVIDKFEGKSGTW